MRAFVEILPEGSRGDSKSGNAANIIGVKLAILKLLVEANGELVSCNTIRRHVYGKRVAKEPGSRDCAGNRCRESGLIRTQICLLNRKLQGSGYRVVNRKGYGWFLTGAPTP